MCQPAQVVSRSRAPLSYRCVRPARRCIPSLSLEPPSPRTLWNASISRGPRAVKGLSAASLDEAGWLIRWEQRGERDNSRWYGVAVSLAELDERLDGDHLD